MYDESDWITGISIGSENSAKFSALLCDFVLPVFDDSPPKIFWPPKYPVHVTMSCEEFIKSKYGDSSDVSIQVNFDCDRPRTVWLRKQGKVNQANVEFLKQSSFFKNIDKALDSMRVYSDPTCVICCFLVAVDWSGCLFQIDEEDAFVSEWINLKRLSWRKITELRANRLTSGILEYIAESVLANDHDATADAISYLREIDPKLFVGNMRIKLKVFYDNETPFVIAQYV